jgi:hypothetical protein
MTKLTAAYALALLLSGCAALGVLPDNRLVCTVAKDKSYVVSDYGVLGITRTISGQDTQVVCQ